MTKRRPRNRKAITPKILLIGKDEMHKIADYNHPKRRAYRESLKASIPTMGRAARRARRRNPGCYGVCCGQGTNGRRLCTVCHKVQAKRMFCCEHWTVRVNSRHEVPRATAKARWKTFTEQFPRYRYRETLKCVQGELPPESEWRFIFRNAAPYMDATKVRA